MLDEYEIKRSMAHKMFNDHQKGQDDDRRRQEQDRRKEASLRRKLNDRRQEALAVEHDRRQKQRRNAERRSFEDRRVTSDYSQERLEQEREKIKRRYSSDGTFAFFVLIFFVILSSFVYLFLSGSVPIKE